MGETAKYLVGMCQTVPSPKIRSMKRLWVLLLLFTGLLGIGYMGTQLIQAIPNPAPPIIQPNVLNGTIRIDYTMYRTINDPIKTPFDQSQNQWLQTASLSYDLASQTIMHQIDDKQLSQSDVYPSPNGRYTAHLMPTGDYAFYLEKQAWLAQHPFAESQQFAQAITQYLEGIPIDDEEEVARYLNGRSNTNYAIDLQNEAGNVFTSIPIGQIKPGHIQWSPNNQQLAIAIEKESTYLLIRYDLASQSVQQREDEGTIRHMAWSEDSQHLALLQRQADISSIVLLEGQQEHLIESSYPVSSISWSNGKLRFNNHQNLTVWNPATKEQLNHMAINPKNDYLSAIRWSPNSLHAIYTTQSQEGERVHLVNLQAETTQSVYTRISYPKTSVEFSKNNYLAPYRHFFWSPDESQIAFVNENGQIVIIDIATQTATIAIESTSYYPTYELTRGNYFLAWSPNGRYIAFPSFYEFNPDSYDINSLYLYVLDTQTKTVTRSEQTLYELLAIENRASTADSQEYLSLIPQNSTINAIIWEINNES